MSSEGSGVKRYVVRCDCPRQVPGPHYLFGSGLWCAQQFYAQRLTLAQARRIVADGPGSVVRLVRKATR